jgi:hypothetical protein
MRGELTASSPFDPPALRRGYCRVTAPCSCHQDGRPGWMPGIDLDDVDREVWVPCFCCDGTGIKVKEVRE